MDAILDNILYILERNHISVYSLSKTAGINQSTLYKILHGQRSMKSKHFYAILRSLPITPVEKVVLRNRYHKIVLGSRRYIAHSYILAMLKDFSDNTYSPIQSAIMPPEPTAIQYKTGSIFRGSSIPTLVGMLLINEMSRPNPKAYVYLSCGSSALSSYVDSTVKLYSTQIDINVIVDFMDDSINDGVNYNINVLRNTVPLALASSNYSFYYKYTNIHPDNMGMTPYPYFIATSQAVLLINRGFEEIMLINSESFALNLIQHTDTRLAGYKKLLSVTDTVDSIVNTIIANQNNITSHYCMEYEPCFSFYFTAEMANAIVPPHIPNRAALMAILAQRMEQLQKITDSIQVFNKDSLMEFARTGIIKEFPPSYARRCTPEERCIILSSLEKACASDRHIIRALSPEVFQISDCLSLIVQGESCLQFSVWNSSKLPLKQLTYNEPSVCKCFYEFINDIVNTNLVYTKEETLGFIREATDYTKRLKTP